MILDDAALDQMRFWTVGSLASATDVDHPAGAARSSRPARSWRCCSPGR